MMEEDSRNGDVFAEEEALLSSVPEDFFLEDFAKEMAPKEAVLTASRKRSFDSKGADTRDSQSAEFSDWVKKPWSDSRACGFLESKEEEEEMPVDPHPDVYYGLLGTSQCQQDPQGHISHLPEELLMSIFCHLPAQDLYQHISVVCHRWRAIVNDPLFVPWKKMYFQCRKGKSQAVKEIERILSDSHITENQQLCVMNLVNVAEINLTHEQQQMLNHEITKGHVVKIMAFAGTVKTSTLLKYAQQRPHLRFLYAAFNKSVAVQAKRMFPSNVDSIMDIVLSQARGKILVGDPHLQIYTFRGAVNALYEVPHTHIYYLTQSFRFGPEIAYVGATLLDVCQKVKKTLVGGNQEGNVKGNTEEEIAILSRSNSTVFDEAHGLYSGACRLASKHSPVACSDLEWGDIKAPLPRSPLSSRSYRTSTIYHPIRRSGFHSNTLIECLRGVVHCHGDQEASSGNASLCLSTAIFWLLLLRFCNFVVTLRDSQSPPASTFPSIPAVRRHSEGFQSPPALNLFLFPDSHFLICPRSSKPANFIKALYTTFKVTISFNVSYQSDTGTFNVSYQSDTGFQSPPALNLFLFPDSHFLICPHSSKPTNFIKALYTTFKVTISFNMSYQSDTETMSYNYQCFSQSILLSRNGQHTHRLLLIKSIGFAAASEQHSLILSHPASASDLCILHLCPKAAPSPATSKTALILKDQYPPHSANLCSLQQATAHY
ncbi:UNVERIFIED_CONTAM: hypothetical protein FKN15_015543 [Acipenser sinensis]